jgi:aspartate 1-decarboxylase
MQLTLLKAKVHRATVTDADLHYEGSISIAEELLAASGILPFEQVDVLNITNGERFTTYAIADAQPGTIRVNGAAARKVQRGDLVIICAYAHMSQDEARQWRPAIIHVDGENRRVGG